VSLPHRLITGLVFTVSVGFLVTLPGCNTGEIRTSPGIESPPQEKSRDVPSVELPSPLSFTPHGISAAGKTNGADFDTDYVGPYRVIADQTSAIYSPDWDPDGTPPSRELALAGYFIQVPFLEGVQRYETVWSQEPPSEEVWLALGNNESNAWDWFSGGAAQVPEIAPYLDPDHRVKLIVCLAGQNQGILEQIDYRLAMTLELSTTPNPAYGDPGLDVSFSAVNASSPNGEIARYAWDLDGDGVYELDDASDTLNMVCSRPGQWMVGLRATDETGVRRTAHAEVKIRGVNTVTVDTGSGSGACGQYNCLLSVLGRPAIAYTDQGTDDLYYIRANDPFGNTWGTPLTIDPDQCDFPSMAVIHGHPAIAYSKYNRLYYVRALDHEGTSWGAPQLLHDKVGTGFHAGLDTVEGWPAIGYTDWVESDVYFIRALDADGTAWDTPVLAYDDDYPCNACEMKMLDDFPAIAWEGRTTHDMMFVTATDFTGSAWNAPQVLDASGWTGTSASMAKFNFIPGLCYKNEDTEELLFMIADKPDGSSWGPPVLVDTVSIYTAWCSLADIDGRPAVCYRNIDSNLAYIRATTALGSLWTDPAVVIDPGVISSWSSLAEITGEAGMSYCGDSELRYARYID